MAKILLGLLILWSYLCLPLLYRLSISTSRKVRPSWPQIRSKLKSFETFIDADAMVLLYSLDSCELSREHTFRTFGGGAKRLERFWEQSHTPTTSRTIIIFSWVSVTRALYTSVPKCPKMSPNVPECPPKIFTNYPYSLRWISDWNRNTNKQVYYI